MTKGTKGRSVLGRELETCGTKPMTGWYRDGCCETDENDRGSHTVCAKVTAEFLEFSRARGNDLLTARPEHGFPGLRPGDRWCLCVTRWREAYEAGAAPPIFLAATHERALDVVAREVLVRFALDVS
jgi:uncharacterized protein (DUF2237 family)